MRWGHLLKDVTRGNGILHYCVTRFFPRGGIHILWWRLRLLLNQLLHLKLFDAFAQTIERGTRGREFLNHQVHMVDG